MGWLLGWIPETKAPVFANPTTVHRWGVNSGMVYGCGSWHWWQVTCDTKIFVFFFSSFSSCIGAIIPIGWETKWSPECVFLNLHIGFMYLKWNLKVEIRLSIVRMFVRCWCLRIFHVPWYLGTWNLATLHTSHCTLYTAYLTLHTSHYTLYTAHYTLYTSHCLLHSVHCTLHNVYCTLHTTHWKLHFILSA